MKNNYIIEKHSIISSYIPILKELDELKKTILEHRKEELEELKRRYNKK